MRGQTEIARKMLAGEIDPHLEPNDFSGRTVAEQLLWGGASSLCAEIVRMALEHVDWPPDDPRWFWMLGARARARRLQPVSSRPSVAMLSV